MERVKESDGWPDGNIWCDELGIKGYAYWPWCICIEGNSQCNVGLNENVLTAGVDIPDDMVLLFETGYDWNVVGGAELAESEMEGEVLIVFANGKSEIVPEKKLNDLRWSVGQQVEIGSSGGNLSVMLLVGGVAVVGLCAAFILGERSSKHSGLVVVVVILSCLASLVFNSFTNFLYRNTFDNDDGLGLLSLCALIVGGICVLCFVPLLDWLYEKVCRRFGWVSLGMLSGAVMGVAASSIVHVTQMIYYDDSNYLKLIYGSGFGIIAGMFLGLICGIVIWRFDKERNVDNGEYCC